MANGNDMDVIAASAIGEDRTENVQRRRPTKEIECRNGQDPVRTIIAVGKMIATLRAVGIDIAKINIKLPRQSRHR